MPRFVRTAVAVSTACGVATAPILWFQFGALPLLTVPANALAEPAIPVLLGLAFVTAGLGVVSPLGGGARRVAERLACGLRRALRAHDRLASVRPGHDVSRSRRRSRAPFSQPPMLGGDGRRAEARLPPRGERPPEGRSGLAAAAQPVRRRMRSSCTPQPRRSGDDVVAAANALGLFAGDGRLIVVDGVEAWKADDAKAIARVSEGAHARDHARPRRRRAEEGRPARQGRRADRRAADLGGRQEGSPGLGVRAVQAARRDGRSGGVPRPDRARRRRPLRARDRDRQARDVGRRRARSRQPSSRSSSRRAPRRATSRSPTPGERATSPACSSRPSSCSSVRPIRARARSRASRHPHEPRRARSAPASRSRPKGSRPRTPPLG